MRTFLAIDFGTTHTTVARLTENSKYEPEIVEIDGKKEIDTALRLDDEGRIIHFGNEAMGRINDAAGTTFYNFKAFVGRGKSYDNPNKSYTAEELSLLFLTYLRQKIEKKYFNDAKLNEIDGLSCVIGCPAEWNEIQKNKIAEIAGEAGFPNAIYCDEPLGVIYYYHYRGDISLNEKQNILVYDFGGGTTDLAIEQMSPSNDGDCEPKLLAAGGVANLGGKDFDDALVSHFISKLGIDKDSLEHRDVQMLEKYSRRIKEKLSLQVEDGHSSAEVTIPTLYSRRSSCTLSLTEDEFETVCRDLIDKFEEPIYDVLNKAGLAQKKIHRIILAGGSSLLYYVKERMDKMFSSKKILVSTNPLEVTVKGLALYGKACACGASTLDVRKDDVSVKEHTGTEYSAIFSHHSQASVQSKEQPKAKKSKLPVLLLVLLLLLVFLYQIGSTTSSSDKTIEVKTQEVAQKRDLGKNDIVQICQRYGFVDGKGAMTDDSREIYSGLYYSLSTWEKMKNWAPGINKNSSGIWMCSDKIYWRDQKGTSGSMDYSTLRKDPNITAERISHIASAITDDEAEQNKIISALTELQNAP